MIDKTTYRTIPEVAKLLGLHRNTIVGHMKLRGLGEKFGRTWLLTTEDVKTIVRHSTGKSGRPRKDTAK